MGVKNLVKVRYNKLVRDKIPEIIRKEKGVRVQIQTVSSDEEFQNLLQKKLEEELNEFIDNPSQSELVDIYEVMTAWLRVQAISWEEFIESVRAKAEERGSFENRIFLKCIDYEKKKTHE